MVWSSTVPLTAPIESFLYLSLPVLVCSCVFLCLFMSACLSLYFFVCPLRCGTAFNACSVGAYPIMATDWERGTVWHWEFFPWSVARTSGPGGHCECVDR